MVLTNDNGLHFLTTLANPFPNGVSRAAWAPPPACRPSWAGLHVFQPEPQNPVTMRWEAEPAAPVQAASCSRPTYVGNKTNHIEITRNINTLPEQYLSTLPTRDDAYNNLLTASIANPLYNLVPGNTQGIYTSTTTSRQTLLSPFPAFGSNAINTQENTGYSWYHSLQFTASKRFSKGYTRVRAATRSRNGCRRSTC